MAELTIFQMAMANGGIKNIDVAPVLTVHANYAAGDYVGTSGVAMEFALAARKKGGSGIIMGAKLIDSVLASVAAELWLFDTAITPPADSAAWTLSDAHAKRLIGVIPFSTYYASALNSFSFGKPENPFLFTCLAASQSLYGCLVTRGAPAYAADGDVVIGLSVMQV